MSTVQLSLVGTQVSLFCSSSLLQSVLSIDPNIDDYGQTLQQIRIMKDSDSSEWKKRRIIKKQKIYECGCGKKYKVQSSLDTHIKTQHAGVSPGPVKLPEKVSRGRPKQNQIHQFGAAEDITNPLEELAVIREGWVGAGGLTEIYEREPVYQLIARFQQPKEGEELKFVEEDKIYQVSMGRGLQILIEQLRAAVPSKDFIDELILLITTYISYVIEETEDQNVLSNGSIGLLPEFINYFLIHDFEKRCERLKVKNLWINTISNVVEVFGLLFRWLVFKKFTHTRASVNRDFLITTEEQQKEPNSNSQEQA